MKSKLPLIGTIAVVVILVAALVVGVSCFKTTGGGWFIDERGDKVTFGFNAQPEDMFTAKGKFQLVAHHGDDNETVVHGTFYFTVPGGEFLGYTEFSGVCSVNGVPGYPFVATFYDENEGELGPGDRVSVEILGWPDDFAGTLEGGNIKIHAK